MTTNMTDPADYVERVPDLASWMAKKSHFLFGPRQTGKSTLVRRQLPRARVYDLLDGAMYLALSQRPGRLAEELGRGDRIVVIDEVQRLPEILNEVHRLIEERGTRFLLTGSSARKLRRGGVNLLGGRARTRHLHPLTRREGSVLASTSSGPSPGPVALGLLLRRPRRGPRGVRRFVPAAGDRRGGCDPQRSRVQPVPAGGRRLQRHARQLHEGRERCAGAADHRLRVLRDPARHSRPPRAPGLDALVRAQAPRLAEVLLLRRRCRVSGSRGGGSTPEPPSLGRPSRRGSFTSRCAIATTREGPRSVTGARTRASRWTSSWGTTPRSR